MIWGSKDSIKSRVFLWQMQKNRIKLAEQLKRKKWKGDEHCKLCGVAEDAAHIIFDCPVAILQLAIFRYIWEWDNIPSSMNELFEVAIRDRDNESNRLMIKVLGATAW